MFKSWLKVQKKLRQRIEGTQRWLAMLKSDQELEAESGKDLAEIRLLALEILQQIEQQLDNQKINSKKKLKKRKKIKSKKKSSTIFNSLFEKYARATDNATKCAIVYLLKNGCQIDEENEDDEDLEEYMLHRRKKEIEIEKNLQKQLRSRLPLGRDLQHEFCDWALEAIDDNYVPEDNTKARLLQDNLFRKSAAVPYPIAYESNTDLTWLEDGQGKLSVKFNGLGDHQFEIRCDTRQIDWFRRFLEDQQLKEKSKQDKKKGLRNNELSSALFGLRSGRILWREGEQKPDRRKKTIARAFFLLFLEKDYKLAIALFQGYGQFKRRLRQEQPWNCHKLYLQCSVDTRLWTQEGTELVAEQKTAKSKDAIAQTEEKGNLDLEQQKHIQRKQTQLANLQNLPNRPHKDLYGGNPSIILGGSLGLEKPVTVAVVDVMSGRVLTYRSAKQYNC